MVMFHILTLSDVQVVDRMLFVTQKFLAHILRSPLLFDLLVPLLYELLHTRNNPSKEAERGWEESVS